MRHEKYRSFYITIETNLSARGFRVSRVPRGFSCTSTRETGNFSLQIETTPLLENILKI